MLSRPWADDDEMIEDARRHHWVGCYWEQGDEWVTEPESEGEEDDGSDE